MARAHHSTTTAHGQTLIPSPTTASGAGKPPGPRLPSTRSRTDSLLRATRLAMSLTDTRSWSTRRGTATGTTLVMLSPSRETAAAGPGATILALTVVRQPASEKVAWGSALETASWWPWPRPSKTRPTL
jgi:hypothetical protein